MKYLENQKLPDNDKLDKRELMLLLDDKIGDINKNDKELQDELLYIYSKKMSYFWRGKYGTPLHEYFRLIVNKEKYFKISRIYYINW